MRLALAILAISSAPAALGAQRVERPSLSPVRVGGELVLGVAAMPLGFVGGGLAARAVARRVGADDDVASRVGYAGGYAGAALATAAAVTFVGTRGNQTGSYASALGGAVVGGLGSFALVRLNRRPDEDDRPCGIGCTAAAAAVFLLPALGSTIAFNASRRYER